MEVSNEVVKTVIRHTLDGLMLCRLTDGDWKCIRTTFSHGDRQLRGGWWLYKGDHDVALALLEEEKKWILC